MSRSEILSHVAAGRLAPKTASRLLGAQAVFTRKNLAPDRQNALRALDAGDCSVGAVSRLIGAESAVAAELTA